MARMGHAGTAGSERRDCEARKQANFFFARE